MKSGLEGRNKLLYGPALPHAINVSMKSGLEGRNNSDAYTFLDVLAQSQ